jgi:hypothetical protein
MLAIFIALGAVLSTTKNLSEDLNYFVNKFTSKQVDNTNTAIGFSAGLLMGNLLYAKTPRTKPSKEKGDADFPISPPPPLPSNWEQHVESDSAALQQILDDLKIKFDTRNFKLDSYFIDSACTMSAITQLYDAFNSKYDTRTAMAFKDGCFLRTIWFSLEFGRIKATRNDASDSEVKLFLKEAATRYGIKGDVDTAFLGLSPPVVVKSYERDIASRLNAKVLGQLQSGL